MVQVLSKLNGNYANVNDFPSIIEATVQIEQEKNSGIANTWEIREFRSMYKAEIKNGKIDIYRNSL